MTLWNISKMFQLFIAI